MNLHGARVILREKEMEDAWNEFQWRSDPELSQLDAARPLSMSYKEFLRIFKGQMEYPVVWARRLSVETLDGIYIGNCMYYDVDVVKKRPRLAL